MFGTFAEQRHFIYPEPDTYEGIFINANMAAYAPAGIAKFIQTRTRNPKYIIDPQTHAFQHNPKHIMSESLNKETDKRVLGLKKSFAKLVEKYGEPALSMAGKKPITPATFNEDETLKSFTTNCIDFQKNFISSLTNQSEDCKYTSFDPDNPDGEADKIGLTPYALIPPYFYMQEATYKEWLSINKRSIEIALRDSSDDDKIFAMLVLGQGILTNSDALNDITDTYAKLSGIDGFIIWIDDLAEFEASSAELTGLLTLASKLNSDGTKEVINLHGSYFTVMGTNPKWGKKTFTGVCHGPEFGERRSIVPVGGGIPIAKYYIPELHQRIRYREAANLFRDMGYLSSSESFYDNVCGCSECRDSIENNPDANFILYGDANPKTRKTRNGGIVRIEIPKIETKIRCLQHYLNRKAIEYQFASTASIGQISSKLDEDINKYESMLPDDIAYLKTWKKVLLDVLE